MRPPVIPPEHVARLGARLSPKVARVCGPIARAFLTDPKARPMPLSREHRVSNSDVLTVRRLALDMAAEGRL